MKRFQEAMNFFYKKHFKRSLFFNLMARFGAFYFSIVKLFQAKTTAKKPPSKYILISENEGVIEKLESKLQKNIERTVLEKGKIVFLQSISKKEKTEIILDTNYLNFKDAITFFEKNKCYYFTYKLLPIESNFIIGSNKSKDRGEILLI
jgi:hypothetical protein